MAVSNTQRREASTVKEEEKQTTNLLKELVYFYLSGAGDSAHCTEHLDKCLTTESYSQFSSEKKHFKPATIVSCLNSETISNKRLEKKLYASSLDKHRHKILSKILSNQTQKHILKNDTP
jgi:hypothetical protein